MFLFFFCKLIYGMNKQCGFLEKRKKKQPGTAQRPLAHPRQPHRNQEHEYCDFTQHVPFLLFFFCFFFLFCGFFFFFFLFCCFFSFFFFFFLFFSFFSFLFFFFVFLLFFFFSFFFFFFFFFQLQSLLMGLLTALSASGEGGVFFLPSNCGCHTAISILIGGWGS